MLPRDVSPRLSAPCFMLGLPLGLCTLFAGQSSHLLYRAEILASLQSREAKLGFFPQSRSIRLRDRNEHNFQGSSVFRRLGEVALVRESIDVFLADAVLALQPFPLRSSRLQGLFL